MSLPEDNPAIQAADLHNVAETGSSYLDTAGEFLSKGVPLAIGSGLTSMANTGIALGNVFGGDFEKINYADEVKNYDDDLSQYYNQHQEGVDLGGFVATSFIPGMGGIKALKMIQAGTLGKSAAAATSLFRSAEDRYLKKALSSIQAETNQVFKQLDGNKIAAIAAGFGEQALQAGAFETAILLTMNQNPVINKEDQSYFSSLLYNSPEILMGALIGGGVGGLVEGLQISGKIKTAIRGRDKEDFISLNMPALGLSDIDKGTTAAVGYMQLRGRQRNFEELMKAGDINERQIGNFEKTQKQKATEIASWIREQLSSGDAGLGKAVWNHLQGLSELGTTTSEDVALRILGAATKITRVTEGDATSLVQKVLFEDGYLSERHAKNIIGHNKIAPEVIQAADKTTQEEARLAGYELFKDEVGNTRVIPGIDYARQLKKTKDAKYHDLIVKLAGDQAGNVTETAYPVLGDIGKVKMNKGQLYVDDVATAVKKYDPLTNTPLESNTNFIYEKLSPKLLPDLGTLEIEATNLPRLEKAFVEGYTDVLIKSADGSLISELTQDSFRTAKLELRQQLINEGHDFGRIARELNVSQQFAETGKGEFILSRIEDHTNPAHGKFFYNTTGVPDKNYLRGVSDLRTRIAIAKEHNEKVAAQILGPAYHELPDTGSTMMGINTLPELGNMIKSADENYGSWGEFMMATGKIAEREFRNRTSEVLERISAADNVIRMDENLTRQFNLVIAKIRSSKDPLVWSDDGLLMPQKLLKIKDETKLGDAIQVALAAKEAFRIEQPEIVTYLRRLQEVNATRIEQKNAFFAAKGSATSWDPTIMYTPPVNTRKYPFIAFVREASESEFRPVSVVTAADASSLEAKIRTVKQELGDVVNIYTKKDLENYYKMQGEYESGLLLGNSSVDVSLKKMGVLSDFVPRTDAEILDDMVQWHMQQEQMLVRNAIELKYAQPFAELRAMGEQFMEFQKSKFGRELTDKELSQLQKDNPYEKYIATGLATSNYVKYDSVWGKINSGVEGFGQSMFKIWDSVFHKANKGEIDWVTANTEATKLGFRPPFSGLLKEVLNPVITDKKIMEPLVAKVNAALTMTVLRLDPLNSLVNILGTPGLIAAELRSIGKNIDNPDVVGKLSELVTTAVPGTKYQLPSMMKLLSNALGNFVKDDGTLLKYYQGIGAVQDDMQLLRNVMDASQLTGDIMKSQDGILKWSQNLVKSAAEMGATLSGNNLSERMVRFVAADIMRQLGTAAQLPEAELGAYINTFVNRVHGNYTASQRPHLFQGAVGHAISLFQTYQFNVMQNMVRFVETNDKAAIVTLLGMQNTLFGLQGNPAFYLLNSAIGNANREHKDLVSGAYATLDEKTANWLMYGLGSNATKTNLYNRGDLTPRYVTVVPTTITDVPAVAIPAKVLANLFDTLTTIGKGGSIKQSILEGIAQNGANRPLAGLAQLAQGYRTTAQGNVLVTYNEIDTWLAAAKISGGEEMNRAVAIDAYYRQLAYKKKDADKIADLGEAFKNKIRSGEVLTGEDTTGFLKEYSRAGGRTDSFNRFMVNQYKNANTSQIEKMKNTLTSPYSKNLGTIMGAEDEEFLRKDIGVSAESVPQ